VSQYIVAPAARADLVEIRAFLTRRAGGEVAGKVLRELRAGMRRVAEMPGIGHLRLELADESLRFYRIYRYLII